MARDTTDETPQQSPRNPPATHHDVPHDDTFKRHGPEPPEDDSGPSPSGDEFFRNSGSTVRNVEPDEQVD